MFKYFLSLICLIYCLDTQASEELTEFPEPFYGQHTKNLEIEPTTQQFLSDFISTVTKSTKTFTKSLTNHFLSNSELYFAGMIFYYTLTQDNASALEFDKCGTLLSQCPESIKLCWENYTDPNIQNLGFFDCQNVVTIKAVEGFIGGLRYNITEIGNLLVKMTHENLGCTDSISLSLLAEIPPSVASVQGIENALICIYNFLAPYHGHVTTVVWENH